MNIDALDDLTFNACKLFGFEKSVCLSEMKTYFRKQALMLLSVMSEEQALSCLLDAVFLNTKPGNLPDHFWILEQIRPQLLANEIDLVDYIDIGDIDVIELKLTLSILNKEVKETVRLWEGEESALFINRGLIVSRLVKFINEQLQEANAPERLLYIPEGYIEMLLFVPAELMNYGKKMNELEKLIKRLFEKLELDDDDKCLEGVEKHFGNDLNLLLDFLPLGEALPCLLNATHADGEDILEGEAEEILNEITPHLESLGVKILDIENLQGEETSFILDYELDVTFSLCSNLPETRRLTLVKEEEAFGKNAWLLATSRLINFVNDLLVEAYANERFILFGEHDCFQLFVPRELALFSPRTDFHYRRAPRSLVKRRLLSAWGKANRTLWQEFAPLT